MTLTHAQRRDGSNPVIALKDLRAPSICLEERGDRGGVFHSEFRSDPRLPDLILARRLGFEKPHNIRKLIERNRAELESYAPLPAEPTNILRDGEKSRSRGRPGTAYQLSEGQCLVLCALSRTPAAAQIRREIVQVFMAWRQGRTPATAIMRHLADHAEVLPAGDVAFLIAPVTAAILDTLSAFESEEEDREHGGDDEPSLSGLTCAPTWFEGVQTIDAEAEDEDEPALGATAAIDQGKAWGFHNGQAGEEEPSLGAPERHPIIPHPIYHRYDEHSSNAAQDDQTRWAAGNCAADGDDREVEDEHGGNVLDEPHDGDPEEPSLGATVAFNQRHAWAQSDASMWRSTGEAEPSLGWTDGQGHPHAAMRGYDDDREEQHDQEHDPAESDIGGYLPCLDQSAEGRNAYDSAKRAIEHEQRAMRSACIRLRETVVRIHHAGESTPDPLCSVVDIIGPALLAGDIAHPTTVL
jgi:hypothetical protein